MEYLSLQFYPQNCQAVKKLNPPLNQSLDNNKLVFYYQNTRSLKNKLDQIAQNIHLLTVSPHILVFTETWLSDMIPSNSLQLHDYNIFRLDRNSTNSSYQRGGGVLIGVKSHLNAVSCIISPTSCEHTFVLLTLKHMRIIIGVIYIPQYAQYDTIVYQEHVTVVEELKTKYPDAHLCLFGDFNLPHLNWTSSGSLNFELISTPDKKIHNAAKVLLDSFALYNLKQFFPHNPSKNYTLDLFFSSLDFVSESPLEPLVNIDANNYLQIFTLR